MEKGYIHIYTGAGKGKTTAALGLALRAAGHGYKTYIGQFMKGSHYGELNSLKNIKEIDVEQFGGEKCITLQEVNEKHKELARNGLARIKEILAKNEYQIVILDEICVTIWFGLIAEREVIEVLNSKPFGVEIVLTGRNASPALIEHADLVTEMQEISHYYSKGIEARNGIEK
ncbi:MAG: cob(I)yrinic acid a,c-diamide adenosyltransferase [Desulfobacteraceae bacterium]|nr:cob(I)yrinic acid a,c-diamide adenosyltransferase [Desulfobacteraceae bacterium]